jgi:TonB family protein
MIRAAILGLTMLLTGAQGVPERPLAPTGKWSVEYADNMCTLSRTYGAGAAAFRLAITPMPGSEFVEIAVLTPASATVGATGDARIQLLPDNRAAKAYFKKITVNDAKLLYAGVSRDEVGDISAATSIRIAWNGKRATTHVAVPGIAGGVRALDTCLVDLMESWGFTREMQARIATRAEPKTGAHRWVKNTDYPTDLVLQGIQGTTRVRFLVDIEGRASDCRLIQSSGSVDLDSITCSVIVKRARYLPAKTTDGTAVPSIVALSFSWEIG